MAKTFKANLQNATNHRNVFTIHDQVIDQVLFQNKNLDPDEVIPDVEFELDDSDVGHVSWEIKGQVPNGSPAEIRRDGETVSMD